MAIWKDNPEGSGIWKGNSQTQKKGAGIAIGIAIGCAIGIPLHNLVLGVGVGIAIGIIFEAAFRSTKQTNGSNTAVSEKDE